MKAVPHPYAVNMPRCCCCCCCRDISAVKDGKVESFVCMGYEQGARVTCLAFQAAGSLLVRRQQQQQRVRQRLVWQQLRV